METFIAIIECISQWAIPAVILAIVLSAAYKRVPMYDSFVTGAKEGFGVAVMIIPYLVAMCSPSRSSWRAEFLTTLKSG